MIDDSPSTISIQPAQELNMSFDALVHGRAATRTTTETTLPAAVEMQLRQIEDDFTIDTAKLKQIVTRFQEELEEGEYSSDQAKLACLRFTGLQKHEQNIVSLMPRGNVDSLI